MPAEQTIDDPMPKPPAQPQLSDAVRAWLAASPVFPKSFTLSKPNGTAETFDILDRDESGCVSGVGDRTGRKGFVLRITDPNTGADYAAKLCVAADYDGERTEKSEALLSAKLRDAGAMFAPPIHIGRVARMSTMPADHDEYVCFISQWINGRTIEQIAASPGELTPELIIGIGSQVVYAINYLDKNGLKHDDLHWGNVMVQPKPEALVVTKEDRLERSIVIVDLGSLKPTEQVTTKSRDDFLSMVTILVGLYNCAWQERTIHAKSPNFLEQLKSIITRLVDDDPTRHFLDASQILEALSALRESIEPQRQLDERPFTPFEAISAEHLADDRMLLNLFQEGLPWLTDVLAPKPVVLTGPRGCGKSMLFRYMAVKTQLKSEHKPDDPGMPIGFGVYVSCSTLLQNHLLWVSRESGRPRRMATEISTYFQLTVLRELVESIAAASVDDRYAAYFGLQPRALDRWIESIEEQFTKSISTPRGQWEPRLTHFAGDIDRTRSGLLRAMLDGKPAGVSVPESFLGEVTQKLIAQCPTFAARPVVFLLDDYTDSRISPEVQSILNPIVFERRSSHYFKVSCERFSLDYSQLAQSSIDPDREFTLVDAGSFAMRDSIGADTEQFLTALIDQRLALGKWKGRCATLIGSSGKFASDPDLATFIRDQGSKVGNQRYYFGMRTLARMWSGDIATVLQVVNAMCQFGNVDANTTSLIPEAKQHDAIVDVSKKMAAAVRDYHPHGPELDRILQAYGTMARHVLVQGSLTKKDKKPRRLYRLEMTSVKSGDILDQLKEINEGAASIARHLLRRAVFHPLSNSRGKESVDSKTFRWEMRPIFRPGFGLSLVRESYVDVKSIHDLVSFLLDPANYSQRLRLTYAATDNQDFFDEVDPTDA